MQHLRWIPILCAALLLCGGCSDEAAQASSPGGGAAGTRAASPEITLLREHLDFGRADLARPMLRELEAELGLEADLCAARLAVLDGQSVEAARCVELARQKNSGDPRVYATAAEVHAAAGRIDTARTEIQRGLDQCQATPEMLRAQGVIYLCQQGGAARGVELIEEALEIDPHLPFVGRALGQGYLLLTKSALAEGDGLQALVNIKRSLARDPDDIDARRCYSECLAAIGEFGSSAEALQALVDEGGPYEAELAMLYKRAGVAALVQSERASAIEAFRRARVLGLNDEELGTGAMVLDDESERETELGMVAFGAEDLERARDHFLRALELAPDSLMAHNHTAVVAFQLKDFELAAEHWHYVLEVAIEEQLSLPDPVHLNLAKALYQAGRTAEALAVLSAYLEREPEGLWVPDSRVMLEHIDG